MKKHYDFSKGKRGAVVPNNNKLRISIRLDADIINWFKNQVIKSGSGNYQTLLNEALRKYIAHQNEPLELTLRRIVREELQRAA